MPDPPNAQPDRCNGPATGREQTMTTTSERCNGGQGAGTVHVTRSRWIGGGKDGYRNKWSGDVRCDDCDGTAADAVPDFASYDDYAAYFADDLRDAEMDAA